MKITMESAIFALKKIHFTDTGISKIRKMKIRNDLSQNQQHTEKIKNIKKKEHGLQ